MTSSEPTIIVGGGLAGCEAAWQLLRRGHPVELWEMKPSRYSPAHRSPLLAELVCSNSLRSGRIEDAPGLLKEEMRRLGSLLMEAADATAVPAGRALAVDRTLFSRRIEETLGNEENFRLLRREMAEIPEKRIVILASGPLTSDPLAESISRLTGRGYLHFYDAISPIVEAETIDRTRVFSASRYDGGEGDYLNCPLEQEEYERFHDALTTGEEVPLHDFEEARFFEGCLPVEVLAKRGKLALAYGPMKPVGLKDPRTGRPPFAVVQLRRENREGTLFNLVGFQTKLTRPEQGRIFRMIPGLETAEFARYGSIHRNTFIDSPSLLDFSLQIKDREGIFFAGQITGVEGYIESAAMGLLAGLNVAYRLEGKILPPPGKETAIGALLHHITEPGKKDFQPMNVNFGLFTPLGLKLRRRFRGEAYARRALEALELWKRSL
ncbi:MAG: methylenetetrahydrofolate--tRNA-(uracil(54)-C(5))-methyltransferase (FADH(2)-oxidizing) TrmFO [Deltaproteobacteria bacterium HGW-Deltaproteobacteria-19]|jgi:methylenetetrahydrofolate--tRNA-(uracil-5-)-methyltransferase|nr:MAG: methylenetetrahydrofolate--tRNA-(uracil(54)-C(5))-methyltransferase (FADH(2)-oxidizing) TrmFO [Deltaproteobacteria bacterium HGW-Deltaproteobacteria-19]